MVGVAPQFIQQPVQVFFGVWQFTGQVGIDDGVYIAAFMQALEEAYEFYDLKKRDRDSRQERLKQLEGNRKAIAEIEKIIENQNESWKDFEVFAERLLGFTMERYGTAWNVEQRNQYFAKEKKLLKAMCENPNTHNIARAQNEAEVLMK